MQHLPEILEVPASWKHNEKWFLNFLETTKIDLNDVCQHSSAEFRIEYYISKMGEVSLTKIKTQNLFIKRLQSKKIKPAEISDLDIDWQNGDTWKHLEDMWEELFEIYNAGLAPESILSLIDDTHSFMLMGIKQCKALLDYIEQQKNLTSTEGTDETCEIDSVYEKWVAIDEKHSKTREGFIYVLSNKLMPSVYKIGFTAGNPDKRASEISKQYNLPIRFEVVEYWRTADPYIYEQRIHASLSSYLRAGEFFETDYSIIRQCIEDALNR